MSLPKFISLLSMQKIFLSRVSLFKDSFEGSVTKATRELRPLVYKDIPNELINQLSAGYKNATNYTYANCWHMNSTESEAMWSNYSSIDGAIAIQSTYKNLANSLNTDSIDEKCYIGKVTYVDETQLVPDGNLLARFMYKKKAFEHEKEVRLITLDFKPSILPHEIKDGIYIPINLEVLIHNIYISPYSPQWYLEIIQEIASKYHLTKPIVISSLSETPCY
ncbi:hypothetical protein [Legionella sp. 28fT52]|uniref:hypothetical protein n=1 Tax=Legionella sp. 28fT52 TaxID=3410134 RepID=UPI003AF511D7